MAFNYSDITGWREPMDSERQIIKSEWGNSQKVGVSQNGGLRLYVMSIALIVSGIVWSWFYAGNINALYGFVPIVIGVVIFIIDTVQKYDVEKKQAFVSRIVLDEYQVVPAIAVQFWYTRHNGCNKGYCRTRACNNFEPMDAIEIPYNQIRYYIRNEVNYVPILLIKTDVYKRPRAVVYGDYI